MCVAMAFAPAFDNHELTPMTAWFIAMLVLFAVIFAINSSIHSYLVVKYAKADKVAVSVGFYYMSNACGRLMGTIGSGVLYTYVGDNVGSLAGTNATAGLAACFLAGTLCSIVAALITIKIDDNQEGLQCGPCILVRPQEEEEEEEEEEMLHPVGDPAKTA